MQVLLVKLGCIIEQGGRCCGRLRDIRQGSTPGLDEKQLQLSPLSVKWGHFHIIITSLTSQCILEKQSMSYVLIIQV